MFRALFNSHLGTFIIKTHKVNQYGFKIFVTSKRLFVSHTSSSNAIEIETSDEDEVLDKIIYHSFVRKYNFVEKKKNERREKKNTMKLKDLPSENIPISLKYITELKTSVNEPVKEEKPTESRYIVNLPFKTKVIEDDIFEENYCTTENDNGEMNENIGIGDLISDLPSRNVGKWMNDYEKYTEKESSNEEEVDFAAFNDYGTPDSSIPVSNTPCGGCGALLHCQDPSIPGYLPKEIYKNCNEKDLRETICQRCHFLKNYNTALSVSVNAADYPKLLSRIKNEKALVILLADMTDLPCSIWPGILDIIGYKRPLFLVGNKIDLLWGDQRGWLYHTCNYLRSCFPKSALVKHTTLISAKTGYGVEELITKLHNVWQYRGDVYLVGCTNVGKSTLFNALLQSDYCKVKAVDLIQRATVAPWPGTTLNLLKFPILRPDGWRLYLRTTRLVNERKKLYMERKLEKMQQKKSNTKLPFPQLVGHIGRTFSSKPRNDELNAKDNFSSGQTPMRFGLNPKDEDFAASKWLYDTPGVMHQEQILDLLTTEEISLTLPKDVIKPRTFNLQVGCALFIGGLARVDYLAGQKSIRFTVFSSHALPVTITSLENADEVYNKLLERGYLVVPHGPKERLEVWPGLERSSEISFFGKDKNESCSDVTLSSAGWVSITPNKDEIVKMAFWTPKSRGVHVREPLLPLAVSMRGKRILKTPAYSESRSPFVN